MTVLIACMLVSKRDSNLNESQSVLFPVSMKSLSKKLSHVFEVLVLEHNIMYLRDLSLSFQQKNSVTWQKWHSSVSSVQFQTFVKRFLLTAYSIT